MNRITKEIWKEFESILKKYELPTTVFYSPREVCRGLDKPIITAYDKHFEMHFVIPDFFEDEVEDGH